ncbi:MAG: hypothetical protein JKX82_07860 [Oleispira sp.]|nr:hypothetical protein [Oleispira sp.]
MYKKLKIVLVGSSINYNPDEVVVQCNFKMYDPSESVVIPNPEGEAKTQLKEMGNYSVEVKFDKDFEPTKSDLLDAVNELDGVVSSY